MLLSVDSNGKIIQTDILISGYVRNIMDECKLEIPDEIIALCFLFWFIKVCDQWDELLHDTERIEVDGLCGKWHGYGSLFGSKIVTKGTFKWSLQLKSKISWGCVGIIKNDERIIQENQRQNNYGFIKGRGCFLSLCSNDKYSNGALWFDHDLIQVSSYCSTSCCDPGTIIEMTLDMDKKTIQYKADDAECKAVEIKSLSEQIGYRLVVTVQEEGNEIELI